jgi:hypothetical protein
MKSRPWYLLTALVVGLAAAACSPYERSGEFYAGAVDPKDFPAVYRGVDVSPTQFGTFEPQSAFVRGEAVSYFAFPIPPGVKPDQARAPSAYVFDPAPTSPFPATPKCVPPPGYAYNQRTDFVPFNEQGNIFTRLPTRTVDMINVVETFTYVPLVAEVAVTSNGVPCQQPKSATNIVTRKDVTLDLIPPAMGVPNAMATGKPDGKFLAWAIIDPAADVRFLGGAVDPKTHLGPQKWGWFDHFLLAYLDGGYVPTQVATVPGANGAPATMSTVLVAQNIFVPSIVLVKGMQVPNEDIGTPSDVLQFKRGEPGYSPLCHVMIYTPPDPANPAMNPKDAAMIAMSTPGKFVYCLQPERQAP